MTAPAGIEHLLHVERERTVLEIAELTDEFDAIVATLAADNNDDEHDPEGATVAYERQRVSALLDRARDRLDDIDEALRRVGQPGFGVCRSCRAPIGAERLAAIPTTTVCVVCAASGSGTVRP